MSVELSEARAAAEYRVEVTMPLGKQAIIRAAIDAAAPLIEAQVREMVAAQIEALDDEPFLKALVGINRSAQAVVEWAAATARGVTE